MIINSKKKGEFICILDKVGENIFNTSGNGSRKWTVRVARGKPYFQKRFPDGRLYELHRLIVNAKPGEYVDHINGNTLDNRSINLRVCTNAANIRNGGIRINNKSGFNGVHWDLQRSRWVAKIKVNYRSIFLGRFNTIQEAIEARRQATEKYWSV